MIVNIIEEASRWKREVAAGNLSPDNIERIKREGIAKSPEEYAAGLRKGSENIIYNSGYNLNTDKMSFLRNPLDSLNGAILGGHYTNFNNHTVRSPDELGFFNKTLSPFKNLSPVERELMLRHEANEAKYMSMDKEPIPIPKAKIGVNNKLVGNHYSMNVIADEAKDANFYKNLFGYDKLNNVRQNRENLVLKDKFGIGYNDINFDNVNNLKRQINNYENNVVNKEINQKLNGIADKFGEASEARGLFGKTKAFISANKEVSKFKTAPYNAYNTNQNFARQSNSDIASRINKVRMNSNMNQNTNQANQNSGNKPFNANNILNKNFKNNFGKGFNKI